MYGRLVFALLPLAALAIGLTTHKSVVKPSTHVEENENARRKQVEVQALGLVGPQTQMPQVRWEPDGPPQHWAIFVAVSNGELRYSAPTPIKKGNVRKQMEDIFAEREAVLIGVYHFGSSAYLAALPPVVPEAQVSSVVRPLTIEGPRPSRELASLPALSGK